MYFLNPVVIFAGIMLLMTLITLAWRRFSRTEQMRTAAGALMRVSLTWCIVMLVMGLIMGLNHSGAHAECQRRATETIPGCAYFFDQYGK